jgi:hypothetical protein
VRGGASLRRSATVPAWPASCTSTARLGSGSRPSPGGTPTSTPGALNCDVDVLRSLIGGWTQDFANAGALIRPAAIAMIGAYLASGHDVVFPQMLLDPAEVTLFEDCALDAGAQFIERWLMDEPDAAIARFYRRGQDEPPDPWHTQVQDIVAAHGGRRALADYHSDLEQLLTQRSSAVVVDSIDGDIEATYRLVLTSLD